MPDPTSLRGYTVHETTASVWHYHLVLGEAGDAVCGHPKTALFTEGLPAEMFWTPGRKSHIPTSHCRKCRAAVGDAVADGWTVPEKCRLEEAQPDA